MKRKLITLVATLSIAAAVGCTRTRVAEHRTKIPDLSGAVSGPQNPIPAVESPLAHSKASACVVLEKLRTRGVGEGRFSVFGRLEASSEGMRGAIDPASSPFSQLFLGETFKVDSPEEFYEKARTEHKAGRLSTFKWDLLKVARLIPSLFRSIQFSATNGKLQEAFPGLFGEDGDLSSSLYLSLARKSVTNVEYSKSEISQILMANVPIYESGTWDRARTDIQTALAAAVASQSEVESMEGDGQQERLCGFVLWQRSLAQLFSFKGYRAPKLESHPDHPERKRAREIGNDNLQPGQVDVSGSFVDLDTGKGVVLTADLIQSYDPSKKAYGIVGTPPQGYAEAAGSAVDGGADALLGMLESGIQLYQATSPAAPWFDAEGSYLLGDITSPSSRAILPHEAHSLSLGLSIMGFKNLAARHLMKVNAQGTPLKPGEAAAGMMILDGPGEIDAVRSGETRELMIPLTRVLKVARSVVYLDTALRGFSKKTAAEWTAKSPTYTEKVLAQLVGSDLFSESELARILTPEERKSILRAQLKLMPMPVALLALQYIDGQGRCNSQLFWNPASGSRQAAGLCDRRTEAELKEALQLLGRMTESPLLLQRGGWTGRGL